MAIPRPNRQVSVQEQSNPPVTSPATDPVLTVASTTATEPVISPQNAPVVVQGSTAVPDAPIVIRRESADSPFRRTSEEDRELLEKLRKFTPSQRARLRSMSVNEGLIPQGAQKLADGSIRVTVTIGPDDVPQLESWAESAGKTLEEQTIELIQYTLSSFLHGEWMPPEAVVAGGGKPATPGAPAGAPAAATT